MTRDELIVQCKQRVDEIIKDELKPYFELGNFGPMKSVKDKGIKTIVGELIFRSGNIERTHLLSFAWSVEGGIGFRVNEATIAITAENLFQSLYFDVVLNEF